MKSRHMFPSCTQAFSHGSEKVDKEKLKVPDSLWKDHCTLGHFSNLVERTAPQPVPPAQLGEWESTGKEQEKVTV